MLRLSDSGMSREEIVMCLFIKTNDGVRASSGPVGTIEEYAAAYNLVKRDVNTFLDLNKGPAGAPDSDRTS